MHVREERKVRRGRLAADQILTCSEHALEDTEHTLNLVLVALDRARDLLGVEEAEPRRLAKVRALAGRLEVQPLELGIVSLRARNDR